MVAWYRRMGVVGALAVGLTGCSAQGSGTYNAAYTDICGQRIGMNMYVADASTAKAAVRITEVTAGDVVAVQVAPCSHGIGVEFDPAIGAGKVTSTIVDVDDRVVGLVIAPALGKVLRIYGDDATPRRLIATIEVPKV